MRSLSWLVVGLVIISPVPVLGQEHGPDAYQKFMRTSDPHPVKALVGTWEVRDPDRPNTGDRQNTRKRESGKRYLLLRSDGLAINKTIRDGKTVITNVPYWGVSADTMFLCVGTCFYSFKIKIQDSERFSLYNWGSERPWAVYRRVNAADPTD